MKCPGCGLDDRKYFARGLCSSCYQWFRRAKMIQHFPRTTRAEVDWVEDYEWLLPEYGDAFPALAERMGVTPGTLEQALRRSGYVVAGADGRPVPGRKGGSGTATGGRKVMVPRAR